MDSRAQLPALALLGLSFTGCPQGDEASGIVGEWQAVDIDGTEYPYGDEYDGSSYASGIDLVIEDDLGGELVFYSEWEYDGVEEMHGRSERAIGLTVDDSAAPQYRVEIPYDPFGFYEYLRHRPAATDVDAAGIPATDIVPTRPLRAGATPDLAPAEFVMVCTLAGDELACVREGDEPPKQLKFVRKPPPQDDD